MLKVFVFIPDTYLPKWYYLWLKENRSVANTKSWQRNTRLRSRIIFRDLVLRLCVRRFRDGVVRKWGPNFSLEFRARLLKS